MQQFSTEPSRLCGSGLELKARIEVLFKILKVMMICSVSWRPVLKCELYKLFFLQFACVWSFTSGTVLYRNTYIVMPFQNKNSLDKKLKNPIVVISHFTLLQMVTDIIRRHISSFCK